MAINPATSVYGTKQVTPLTAVVDVDIRAAVGYAPGEVSAKANVVVIAGSLDSSGTIISGSSVVVGNVASGSADSGNPVKVGGVYNATTPPTLTTGQRGDLQLGSRGSLRVQIALPDNTVQQSAQAAAGDAFSNTINALNSAAFGYVFNGTTWDRDKKATTTARIVSSAATTNATSVKASAGAVHGFTANNTAASVKYLKFYNKASAPTVGTDTPIWTEALQPSNVPTRFHFPKTLYFSTGIAIALTGAAADADTTALAAGDVTGLNIAYD